MDKEYYTQTIKYPILVIGFSFLLLLTLSYMDIAVTFTMPLPTSIDPQINQVSFLSMRILLTLLAFLINYQYFVNWYENTIVFFNRGTLICLSILIFFLINIYNSIMALRGISAYMNYGENEAAIIILIFAVTSEVYAHHTLKHIYTSALTKINLPKTALLYDLEKHEEKSIDADNIKTDDIITIKDNMIIPADGQISWGEGQIDESCFRGSQSITKVANDNVFMGTLNTKGNFQYRVTAIPSDSFLCKLENTYKISLSSSAATELRMLKVEKFFYIFILSFAALCTAVSLFLQHTVFSSCALAAIILACGGLTSFSDWLHAFIQNSISKCAANGIYLLSANIINTIYHIDTVIFGKSGILTEGTPKITAVEAEGIMPKTLLSLAASAEKDIDHPLARALVSSALKNKAYLQRVSSAQLIPGKGVESLNNGDIIRVGSATWLKSEKVEISAELTAKAAKIANDIKTPLFIALRRYCHGILAVTDPLRVQLHSELHALQQMKIVTMLFTGDNKNTAKAVLAELGIDQARSELSAVDKAREIDLLHTHGFTICAVGNTSADLLMLKSADVGVFFGYVLNPAIIAASSVIIPGKKIESIVNMLTFCRHIVKKLRFIFILYPAFLLAAFAVLLLLAFSLPDISLFYLGIALIICSLRLFLLYHATHDIL